MDDQTPQLVNLLVVAVLILANGFFVAAEFATLGSSSAKLKAAEEREKSGTITGIWLVGKLDVVLASTQLGITVCTLLLGWFGIRAFAQSFERAFMFYGLALDHAVYHPLSVILSLILVALLHVIFAELVIKSVALRYPEQTLRLLSGPMVIVAQLFRPFLFVITGCGNWILKLAGTSIPAKFDRCPSVSELSLLVSQSREDGVFGKEEEKMLRGVFGFSDTIAREIMTPRTDLVAVSVNASYAEVVQTIVETGLSRFPVKGEEIDNIVGVLLVKDLFGPIPEGQIEAVKNFSLARVMREPYFIPGTKPIDDLLSEFKRRKTHMAIVLDEHGGVDGLVTLEDVIEEIVGDIFDESDETEHSIVVEENGDVLVDGGTLVADLNERFSLAIPEGDYDTIAGFIFTSLGRMTKVGDQILISSSGTVQVNGSDSTHGNNETTQESVPNSTEGAEEESAAENPNELPNALITVEKVESNRIETVRLKTMPVAEHPEPQPLGEASES
jgi:CBS domain containing-hemolysin-like protein